MIQTKVNVPSKARDYREEWLTCRHSCAYFIHNHVQILSTEDQQWIPFRLWPAQMAVLRIFVVEDRIIILKARQLGFTTLTVQGYVLWRMLFHPVSTIGLFSKGETEAVDLKKRLREAHDHLPPWLQTERFLADNAHYMEMANGSSARAMSTKKGESFTFSLLVLDEFDRFDNAAELMRNVKPTADAAGSQIIVGSIADKDRPESIFKNTFVDAREGRNEWFPIFLPWWARPGRGHPDSDTSWYEAILADAVSRHGGSVAAAQDEIFQQYPANEEEALAPRKESKRIPYASLQKVYHKMQPLEGEAIEGAPSIPGLRVYKAPDPERRYVMGADPAEGVEGGDDSAARVLDRDSGEEVAALDGKFEPKRTFPGYLFQLAIWYNEAAILVERNNHGHAVIGRLNTLVEEKQAEADVVMDQDSGEILDVTMPSGAYVEILLDPNDKKEGWLTSPSGHGKTRGKVAIYDTGAQRIFDKQCTIHDPKTVRQLASIDINTLRAPEGHDDCADAFVLAVMAQTIPGRTIEGDVFL